MIKKSFFFKKRKTQLILDHLYFSLKNEEICGLMGDSGSGKSSFAKSLLGLHSSLVFQTGKILLKGRGQMVFQDISESLNPRHSLKFIIEEPFIIQGLRKNLKDSTFQLLESLGLPTTSSFLSRYPHQISGGEQARLAIARLLVGKPKFLIFDESLSMLDFYTQRKMIKLLQGLHETFKISYLFISHDRDLIRNFTDNILILDKGKISKLR